ncbi:hypothetical protein FQA39_LY09027 [Lamprigera yunnana]|nr:hypothetical protein FQA39_LY09027 [Lamprigera yunnana]
MEVTHKASKKKPAEKGAKKHLSEVIDKIVLNEEELPIKVFESRHSLVTELLENKHFQTLYHIITAMFMAVCINTIAYDYLYNENTRFGLRLFLKCFRNLHYVLSWWLCAFLLSLCPYFGVKYWFVIRRKLGNNLMVYVWDRANLIIYVLFLIGLVAGMSTLVVKIDVGFASGVAAVMEAMRIFMKVYSFCRVNIAECLQYKSQKNSSTFPYPTFKHYFYYSLAPTLIYRHSYPRTCLSAKAIAGATQNKMESNNNTLNECRDKIHLNEDKLRVKFFEDRQSPLTELFKDKHIRAIYRIFATGFVVICIDTAIHDYLDNEHTRLGFRVVLKSFRNLHYVFSWWLCVFIVSLCPYFGVKYWFVVRSKLKNQIMRYFWDRVNLIIYVLFLIGLVAGMYTLIVKNDVGFGSGLVALTETIAIVMKIYAFCRVNIAECLQYKSQKNSSTFPYPTFKHYLYFYFAPTLIYRHSYPRLSGKVRWNYVAAYILELICTTLFFSLILVRKFLVDLHEYGLKPYTIKEILMIMLSNSLYGLTIMLLLNYIVLHICLNVSAEIFRFSDRLFYKDWWTSATYGRYYTTWNIFVNDWLYTYIYKDCYEILMPKRRNVGKLIVFFISSFMHDVLFSSAVGFFLPIFIVYFFICGNFITHVKFSRKSFGNVFLFFTLGLGSSMIITLYILEYYARLRCDNEPATVTSYFTPKLLSC